ncbi:tetratricopeptide repeat protein [Microbacterium sp. EYE_5]|uniref:tetratricopeptide repeat protein n=1 Tax=unclassified Microbacterium TaxID=2609290 RepID=UPI002004E3BA|nr:MULTISPECIES: tetratricopeptide repeat protein [unclassified Microbacterium]MCK6080715.1 tetratricopeptide repeat protein [Microbacterium sp. EYE_382]MCK6085986.1 tetratricopeptide repeat protein [Microbacterium sp. EYE_384]MCK6124516.1 tetratricopeptide repeat protein [Microbacterium sp. EYE_80]MCK6127425.1 tetratricopeptide repeat protein [Microbacterium sp. EYE_79]MCK6141670.1 tetratricopeptide repeat protein [Microbacterium sp. EYE_39]
MTEHGWVRESSGVVYDGFTRIRRDVYRSADGESSEWDVLDQGDTVAVIAFTPRDTVVLFDQFRVGPRRVIAELPGGAVDEGEGPVDAGIRELAEETGYRPGAVFHAGSEWGGANSTRRKHVLIAAECDRAGPPTWGRFESGVVRELPVDSLVSHLVSGDLSDAGVALRGLHAFMRATELDGPLVPLQHPVRKILASGATGDVDPGDQREQRIADVWASADDARPDALRAAMDGALGPEATDDARALFERASVEDFLGEEAAAIPLYRAALDAGLTSPLRSQAIIQLASSLRNVGDASGAIAVLRRMPAGDALAGAAGGFRALALYDDDKPARALRTALDALAGEVPMYSRALRAYAEDVRSRPRIRVIAVAVLVRDGHVLAEEYPATAARGAFLRAPGGGVQPGETVDAAVRRELAEELGATVTEATLLGVLENIFDNEGRPGHEIVHVFGVRSPELEALPVRSRLSVLDGDTSVGWYPLDRIDAVRLPFHPPGALDLARTGE